MKPAFETYIKGKGTTSPTFEIVIHGEGVGKFNIRKVVVDKAKGPVFTITSAPTSLLKFQEFIESIPGPLEEIFEIGAISIGYYEGEITLQFPENFSENLTADNLQAIADFAVAGMPALAERYAEYQDDTDIGAGRRAIPAFVAMLIILLISTLSIIYGVKIVPIEWLHLGSLLFAGQIFLGLIFIAVLPALREINKIILFSLLGANSILLMLLIGFFSLLVYPDRIESQEGTVENVFSGGRMGHLMRIRLVEDRYKSYLVPKRLLNRQPEYLPRAARFQMRKGLFGTRYIESVGLF